MSSKLDKVRQELALTKGQLSQIAYVLDGDDDNGGDAIIIR